jgi:hypothetical protein
MVDLTSPLKRGFSRLRGRPKSLRPCHEETLELRNKRHRVGNILDRNSSTLVISWLHIMSYDKMIDQDLFEVGCQYLRLRSSVLRGMATRSFKLGCHALTRSSNGGLSAAKEKRDKKAEEFWYCLSASIPSKIIHTLDELLLGEVNYDLPSGHILLNKERLKTALMYLSRYKDLL